MNFTLFVNCSKGKRFSFLKEEIIKVQIDFFATNNYDCNTVCDSPLN